MQRTAPSTPPRRQENYEGSPALMMASRIRAEPVSYTHLTLPTTPYV